MRELERENRVLREEREILKRAAAFFAPPNDAAARVSRATARAYLNGQVLPSTRVLLAICDWLELNAPWLRSGIGAKYREVPDRLTLEEKVVIAYFRAAPSAGGSAAASRRVARGGARRRRGS